MAIHHRLIAGSIPRPPVSGTLRRVLRFAACAAFTAILAACMARSPAPPETEPETPASETSPENDGEWNAVTG